MSDRHADLEAALAARSRFLAAASHEIRTPLNAIAGLTELVLDGALPVDAREHLQTIQRASQSLLAIVDGLLDFAKIEAGRLELVPSDVDLRQLLADTVRTFALQAEAKDLDLVVDVHWNVPDLVRADASRLRQVVANLVGNAIKFTSSGEVVVSAAVEGGRVAFAVRDTGIGIDKEQVERIFDPFRQASADTAQRFGGTGLGLSISRMLVGLWNGRLSVFSEPGIGSRFVFDLPIAFGIVEALPPPPRGARALVAVAHNAQAMAVARMLEAWGCEVRVVRPEQAGDAREGAAVPFDFVVGQDCAVQWRRRGVKVHAGRAAVVLLLPPSQLAAGVECVAGQGLSGFVGWPCAYHELRREFEIAIGLAVRPDPLAHRTPSLGPAGRRLRVLVAEDNVLNQRLIAAVLRRAGHELVLVGDGLAAVEACGGEEFDLVLMDLQMPRLDGFEAARRIRGREAGSGRRTPIVALTANLGAGEACADAGIDAVLTKPILPGQLLARLAGFVVDAAAPRS